MDEIVKLAFKNDFFFFFNKDFLYDWHVFI